MVQVHFLALVQDISRFHCLFLGIEPVDRIPNADTIDRCLPADDTEIHGFVVVFGGVGFCLHHVLDYRGTTRKGNQYLTGKVSY